MSIVYPATFYDGVTAEPHEVTLEFSQDALRIVAAPEPTPELGAAPSPVTTWSYAGLRAPAARVRSDTLALTHDSQPGARLVLASAASRARLAMHVPRFSDAALALPRHPGALVFWLVVSITSLGLVLFGARAGAKPVAAFLPASLERLLGDAVQRSLVKTGTVVATPEATAALQRLRSQLVPPDTRGAVSGSLELVDDDTENAFATPGGHVVVYCGLVRSLESPDELAAIVAHELAHGRARHPTAALLRVFGVSALVGSLTGDFGGTVSGGGQILETLVRSAHSREDEAEADTMAKAMLTSAGLRTDGFVTFFQRRATKSSRQAFLQFLSTHPPDLSRAVRVLGPDGAPLDDGSAREPLTEDEWSALRDACTDDGEDNEDTADD